MQIKNLLFYILIFLTLSCEEPYNPDFKEQESFLVVDGILTNDSGPVTVILSRSTPVDSARFIPEKGAVVKIFSDNGLEYFLQEYEKGIYISEPEFKGEIGKAYKLSVKTSDGQVYETGYQIMKQPVNIDSFYYKRELYSSPSGNDAQDGYRFYVNAVSENENNYYLMWRLTETYEYNSVYKIDYIYISGLYEFSNPDTLYTCWKTADINTIKTFSSNQNEAIYGFPLTFVSKDTKKLSIGYSLELKQYSISESAYNYWHALEDMNNQSGNLYSQQPYQIKGNLVNQNNPDEVVLGYFTVAGSSKRRIFAEPRLQTNNYITNCAVDDILLNFLIKFGSSGFYYVAEDENGVLGVVSKGCVDCTLKGGKTQKPDFWIY